MQIPEIEMIGMFNSQKVRPGIKISSPRTTNLFEIELPIEKGGISYIDSKKCNITPDLIICAKPGQIRHSRFPHKCYYVHFHLEKGYLYDTLFSLPEFIKIEDTAYYQHIFHKLYQYYDTGQKHDEILLQSLLLELIHKLYCLTNTAYQPQNILFKNPAIKQALVYIQKNLTEPLNLKTISDHVSLSPNYFHNCFKTAIGQTVHEYIEEQRLKHAINLLLTTDLTLTQTAYQCGFSSQSYFSFVFKRKFGKTPREYIRQLNERYQID